MLQKLNFEASQPAKVKKKKKEENKKEPFSHPAFGALCLEYSVCKISVGFFLVLHNGSVILWTRGACSANGQSHSFGFGGKAKAFFPCPKSKSTFDDLFGFNSLAWNICLASPLLLRFYATFRL